MPGGAEPRAAVAMAIDAPATTMAAARTAPATPSRRCTATRRLEMSAVWTMKSSTQAVKSAPCTWTSGVKGPPVSVAVGPPLTSRR